MQVKSWQQQHAEKLTKNDVCLPIDLQTQPLVSYFLIHGHTIFHVPEFMSVKWQSLKTARLSDTPDKAVYAQAQSSEEEKTYLWIV